MEKDQTQFGNALISIAMETKQQPVTDNNSLLVQPADEVMEKEPEIFLATLLEPEYSTEYCTARASGNK